MCKWRWDAGVQLKFTQGLDCNNSKCQGLKRKTPKTVPFLDTVHLLQRLSRPPPPLHLQSMVETALFSGYKSQRTKGHKEKKRGERPRKREKGRTVGRNHRTGGEKGGKAEKNPGREEWEPEKKNTGASRGEHRWNRGSTGKERDTKKPEELLRFSPELRNRKLAFPHPEELALPETKQRETKRRERGTREQKKKRKGQGDE